MKRHNLFPKASMRLVLPLSLCVVLTSCHTYSYSHAIYMTPKTAKVEIFYSVMDKIIRENNAQDVETTSSEADPRRSYKFTIGGKEYHVGIFEKKNVLKMSSGDGTAPVQLLALLEKELDGAGIKAEDVKTERIAYESSWF